MWQGEEPGPMSLMSWLSLGSSHLPVVDFVWRTSCDISSPEHRKWLFRTTLLRVSLARRCAGPCGLKVSCFSLCGFSHNLWQSAVGRSTFLTYCTKIFSVVGIVDAMSALNLGNLLDFLIHLLLKVLHMVCIHPILNTSSSGQMQSMLETCPALLPPCQPVWFCKCVELSLRTAVRACY